jgi:DNA repair exonuclease SbcCD ATPase subunit
MLEQGAFAKFLHASSVEREGLLRDIFKTHSIEEFTTHAVNRAKELQQQVEISASTLTALTGVTSAKFAEWLSSTEALLNSKSASKTKLEEKLKKANAQFDTLTQKLGELESKRKTAEELTVARKNYENFLQDDNYKTARVLIDEKWGDYYYNKLLPAINN